MKIYAVALALCLATNPSSVLADQDLEMIKPVASCNADRPIKPGEIRFETIESFVPPKENIAVQVPLNQSEDARRIGSFVLYFGELVYSHLKAVTFVKKPGGHDFLFDFYMHGKAGEPAIQIKDLDFRAFFFPAIQIEKGQPGYCMRKVQSFFAEFNRKDRVFCHKGPILKKLAELPKNQETRQVYEATAFAIVNNCREGGNFEYKLLSQANAQLMKGHFMLPLDFYDGLLKKFNDGIGIKESATGVRTVSFYRDYFRNNQAHQKTLKEIQGTWGAAIAAVASWWSGDHGKDGGHYRWEAMPDPASLFDGCSLKDLDHVIDRPKERIAQGPVEVASGPIHFNEYISETGDKSAAVRPNYEALVYLKTPCPGLEGSRLINMGPPEGFEVSTWIFGEAIQAKEYWNSRPCTIVPHRFIRYEELAKYDVHLSSFEVDGVYNGYSWFQGSEFARKAMVDDRLRWDFDIEEFIGHFESFEIFKKGGRLEILLKNSEGRNITVSNVSLAELKALENNTSAKENGIYSLFGIGAQPIVSNYNHRSVRKHPLAIFMHDEQGRLINHHLKKHGVEQIYIRKKACNLQVDMVSHERIQPLWRGLLKVGCSALGLSSS